MKYNFKKGNKLLVSTLSVTVLASLLAGCPSVKVIENTENVIVSEINNESVATTDTVITEDTTENIPESVESEQTQLYPDYTIDYANIDSRLIEFEPSEYLKNTLSNNFYNYTGEMLGFDSIRYRENMNNFYINNVENTDLILTIDDFKYFNTGDSYEIPMNIDQVKNYINSFGVGTTGLSYMDAYKNIRAILISLNLVPYINEIPAEYISSQFESYCGMEDGQLYDYCGTICYSDQNTIQQNYTNTDIMFYTVASYNIAFHHNWQNNLPISRTENGALMLNLHPTNPTYKLIIQAFSDLGMPLNTETMIDPETGEEIEVIVPDTPEHFEEIFGESYTDVLERAGLPLNPEHDNFFPDPNSYGFMVDANENEVEKNASYFRTR